MPLLSVRLMDAEVDVLDVVGVADVVDVVDVGGDAGVAGGGLGKRRWCREMRVLWKLEMTNSDA